MTKEVPMAHFIQISSPSHGTEKGNQFPSGIAVTGEWTGAYIEEKGIK
jgi:hypothetical protein